MKTKNLHFFEAALATPFMSSEEAWLWYCLCEQLGFHRNRGTHERIQRPCESSDIFLAVQRLRDRGVLGAQHLTVLSRYGQAQSPPHPSFGAPPRACGLWHEAMHFLDTILKPKGIVIPTLFILFKVLL